MNHLNIELVLIPTIVYISNHYSIIFSQVKSQAQPDSRVRGSSVSKPATAQNQYSREPLSARQSWGQPAYPAQPAMASNQLYNPAAQPVAPVSAFTPAPQLSAYQVR